MTDEKQVELTAKRFDDSFARPVNKIWGLRAIAAALGVSVDTARKWARDPDVPIYRPKGYFAFRNELEAWLRSKP